MILKPHQVAGVAWLKAEPRRLLADTPGSGKTAQLLIAARAPTLVIGPASLAGTWMDECEKWRPDLLGDLTFCSYASVPRRAPDSRGHLTKTEPFPRSELTDTRWGTVICDEAHWLKNTNAKWTRAVEFLAKNRNQPLYLATGTPIINWAPELLMLLRLLFPGDKRFTNRHNWLYRWFKLWSPPYAPTSLQVKYEKDDPNKGLRDDRTWAQFWTENGLGLEGAMLRREVGLDIPVTTATRECPMGAPQARFYKELKKNYLAELPPGEDGLPGKEIVAWSSGGLHTKLAIATAGVGLLDEPPTIEHSSKMDTLRELLEEYEGQPIVVFTQFRATAYAAGQVARGLGCSTVVITGEMDPLERDTARRMFQDGKIDVLIGTLGTVAEGWTLTRSSLCIFVEHSWRPSTNDQALKRLARLGQQHHVHAIHLYTPGSIDTGMAHLLALKTDHQVLAMTAAEFIEALEG